MGFIIKKNTMQARNTNGEMEPVGLIASAKNDVNEWLDKHPEATTSVKDNSIGKEKLTKTLSNEITASTAGVKKNAEDISDLYEEKADRTELASPYKFKGSLDSLDNLPLASTDNWNDTYYIKSEKQRYTSNGSNWFASSMSEVDYTDELGKVVSEESLANEFTKVSYKIGSGGVEVPTMDEFNEVVENLEDICNQQMHRNFKEGYVYTDVDNLYFNNNDVRAYDPFIVKAGNHVILNDVYGYFCYFRNSNGNFHLTEKKDNVYTTSIYVEEDTEFYISERTGIGSNFGVYYGKYEHIKSTNLIPNEHIIEVGKGKQFTSLLDAGLYSKNHPNTNLKIVVYGGEYNLINEFKDVYGENFFDDMQEGEYGIPIGFGEKWLFAPNANIHCLYNGTNNNVHNSFCCFYTAQGGGFYDFELVGLHVLAENIKYCVHDQNISSSIPYHHKYVNCNMVIRQNGSSSWSEPWWATKCIGGGLGECGNIEIDGCIFDSQSEVNNNSCVSYHNAYNEKSVSSLIIKNSYIAGNKTVRFGYYGKSTNYSTFIVSNNSLGLAPIKEPETPGSTDNVSMIIFGNEIRNNQ